MLTVQEAAAELGINQNTVYQAISRGGLESVEMYGRKLITRSAMEAYRKRTRPDGVKPKGRPRTKKQQN